MKHIEEKIFKAYDIRGLYPNELDERGAFLIGQAFVELIKPKKVLVGRDMRVASPSLAQALVDSITGQGIDVDFLGDVPVDAFYYMMGKYGYEGGIYCTASHNPKDYHGFKCFQKNFESLRGVDLRDIVISLASKNESKSKKIGLRQGTLKKMEIMDEFIQYLLKFVDVKSLKPFRIVVDAGNGMAGKTIPLLSKFLPVKIEPLFFELDGNFPNHPSNPLEAESQKAICQKVVETGAHCGVIFDGDTDRVFFVDEKGKFIPADMTLLLLAKYQLKKHSHAGIVYNAICSRAVPEFVEKWGGHAYKSKVGFVNVREKMRETGSFLGGEVSAHYAFRENYYADSGNIAFLNVLQILSEENRFLSSIVSEFQKYFRGDEINITVDGVPEKISALQKKYADGKIDLIDGITVEYNNYWFNVRPSNTEALLRITIEGNNKKIVEEKKMEIIQFLQK